MASIWATSVSRVAACTRAMSTEATVVSFKRHGPAAAVLGVEKASLSDPKGSQVLVQMLAAPVSPVDIASVEGFGAGSPGVGGSEGVGKVVKTGSDVKGLSAGDVVVAAGPSAGTWGTFTVAEEAALLKTDGKGKVEEAAVSFVSPATAQLLLDSFADLKKGDVIVQNNAGSTVGQAVIQLAAARGIQTVNILRKRDNWDDFVNHLQGLGASVVVDQDFARTPAFKALVADLPAATLGLNSVGGAAAVSVADALGEGATLVTFGASARKPLSLPLAALVDKDITVKGFNFSKWLASASAEEKKAVFTKAAGVKQLVKSVKFSEFSSVVESLGTAGERKPVVVFE